MLPAKFLSRTEYSRPFETWYDPQFKIPAQHRAHGDMLYLGAAVQKPARYVPNCDGHQWGGDVIASMSTCGMSGEHAAIWFGILVVKMAELCLITPPIGLNCFVVAGLRPELNVQDVFRGASPYFAADVVTIAVLIMFPEIVLFLPKLLG